MTLASRDRPDAGRRHASANDRFKARFRAVFWGSMLAAAILHGVILWLSPVLGRVRPWLSRIEAMALSPPLDVSPSPPPATATAPPVPGIVGSSRLEDIPPPPEPLFAPRPDAPISDLLRKLIDGPTFTPYSVAPALKNRDAVVDALGRFYRAEGPGIPDRARADVWFLIDEFGAVRRTLIKESTGNPELDHAVLRAAALMEFTPAWSGDRAVPVWVSLPVVFRIELEEPGAADTTGVGKLAARPDGAGSSHRLPLLPS